jgi:hypothetical protein
MAKKKTTVYLDEELLRATKVAAARSGRREYQVFEAALRRYLGLEEVEAVWARSDLDEDEALDLAYREVHAARKSQ